MSEAKNEKRIVKNTIFLYFRMIVTMAVSIYTSRVVLDALGVQDYGIFNVVAGVIVFFAFVNTSLNASTQRYLNTAMSTEGENAVKKVFNNSLYIYALLSLIVFISGEIFGFYFIDNVLNIPEDRHSAAIFIFHVSLITLCIQILRTPYNAMVIAYEKMSFFAYSSIVESLLRLGVVWLLIFISGDKLEIYSLLICAVTAILTLWYLLYCQHNLRSCRYQWLYDKKLIKSMLSFTGWNLFGGFADLIFTQGTNIILNIFHGVTLNAAFGLANQIKTAIFSFVSNLQVSANPQIVKSYAANDIKYFTTLIYAVSKYSYFLMLIIALPLIFNIDFILKIWLVDVPAHTSQFIILIIILILFDSLQGPLWTGMQANGNIRNYQIVTSFLMLLNLPLAYIALKLKYPSESIIWVQILVKNIVMVARLWYAEKMCFISIKKYFGYVIWPIAIVSAITVPIIYILTLKFDSGISQVLISTISSTMLIIISVYLFGLTKVEKSTTNKYIKTFVSKRIRNE